MMRWKMLAGVLVFSVACISVHAAIQAETNSTLVGLTPPNIPADVFKKSVTLAANNVSSVKKTQTDPSLRMLGLTLSETSTDVLVEGAPGWTYNVLSTSDFASANWGLIGFVTIGGQGNAVFNDMRERLQPSQFYRISKRETSRAVVSVLAGLLLPAGSTEIPLAVSTTGTNGVLNLKKEETK